MTSTETSTHSTTGSSTPTTTVTTESTTTATTESSTTLTSTETSTHSTTISSTPTTTGTTGVYSASSNMFASWQNTILIVIGIAVGMYLVNFAWKRFWNYRAQIYKVETVVKPTPNDIEAGRAGMEELYFSNSPVNTIYHTNLDSDTLSRVSDYSYSSSVTYDEIDNMSMFSLYSLVSELSVEPVYTQVIPRELRNNSIGNSTC